MNILFYAPSNDTLFPKSDSITKFLDWMVFAEQSNLNQVFYSTHWDDILTESKKDILSPIFIYDEKGMGTKLRLLKRRGRRIFAINNFDYTIRMENCYATPIKVETFEELKKVIELFAVKKSLTTGILKNDVIGFEDGKIIEIK
jgi:hypothetical protein